MNQQNKQVRLGFFEKFITIMIIIKKEHQLSKISSAVLVTIPYFQLVILILQQRLTKQIITDSPHFQLVRNFIRPDIWLIEQENINLSILFMIVLVIILLQKIKLTIIVVLYYYILNQENLLAQIKNNLMLKIPISILSLYQQIISLVLFQWFSLFIACSLKRLLDNIRNDGQFIYFFLIFILLITLTLLIFEIFFNIRIIEKPITLKIYGLERKNFSSIRIFTLLIEFAIQFLYIFQTNPQITFHILIVLSISKCVLDLFDLYFNQIFVNPLIINFLISSISFTVVIYCLIEFVDLQNQYGSKVTFETLMLTPPLILIIKKQFQFRQQKNFVKFFQSQTISQSFIHHLINIVNFSDWEFCTIHRSLIQGSHYKNCTNTLCTICNHMYILDTTSAQGITINIFKEFILSKLKFILQDTLRFNFTDLKGQKQSKRRFLSYVLLLYDFGWVMQSLQYLYQLKYAQNYRAAQEKHQQNILGTLPKTNSFSDRNSHHISDNQTIQTAQQNKETGVQFQINILINQIKFNMFEKISIEIILEEARRIIQKNFGSDDSFQQQSITSDFVGQYLINEVQVEKAQEIIAHLTKEKIAFYENILKQNFEEQQKVSQWQNQKNFHALIHICKGFKEGENQLLSMFQKKPSFLLHQSINLFYCFLQNDYEKALHFSKNQQFLDERQNKFLKIKNFNVNSKDIHYLIITLQDDMQHLAITSHSPQFFDQYGVLKNIKEKFHFEDLAPLAVTNFHHLFVRQFLEVGQCKFFRMFDINFIIGKDSFLETVFMNVDTTELYHKNNLTFSVFLQKPTEDLTYLLIDSDKHYCQFTKTLFFRLGWTKEQVMWFQSQNNLNQFPIENILPDFSDILESLIKLNETSLTQIEFVFPKPPERFKSQVQLENLNIKASRKIFEKQNTMQNLKYLCDIVLYKRQIYSNIYYVIQISYIQKYQNLESGCDLSASRQKSKIIEEADFDSEIEDLDNNHFQQIVQDYQKQIRDSVTSMQKNTKLFSNYPTDPIMEEILSPGRICLTDNIKNTDRKNQEFQDLLNNLNQNKDLQQQFFRVDQDYNSQSSFDQMNSQLSQRKARQSRTKTLNEISKESLFRKYDTIHKILNHSKPKFFYQLIVYSYLFFFAFSAIPIFTMSEFNSDLNILIEQIEMLQLHASIMGPHDLFFSMRITITSYQIMYKEGFLTAKELSALTQPFLQYLPLGYQELQDNFYIQLNNPYLASFLNDVNIQVWFMGANSSVITPQEVTFRDNLFIMLQYQQQQLAAYLFNRAVAGQPFQVFLIANYLIMQNTCESLTAEIKVYSEWKCNQIHLKWGVLELCFAFILIILLLIVYYYQRKFFNQYNSFISLLKHNNDDSILGEISRYKGFLNSLSYHNIDEFNLEKEYNKVIQLQIQKENAKQIQLVYAKYHQFYPQIKNNVVNIVVLILMVIYGIVVFAEADYYLSKYNITTDFFKLIQELKFRGGNGFLYRELFFRFNSYPFLTNSDLDFLYTLLARSQQAQSDFNELISSISYDKYLITQDFIDLLEFVQVNQMCSQVQKDFQPLMDQYCSLAFEGILKNGIVPALNYLHNQIATQQQMNNFTKRVEMHKYELEGSQIITRAFFTISDSFKQSFKDITNYTIQSLNDLSISYLVISGFIVSIMILFYQNYLINQYNLLKKIIYLVPLQIFLQDGYLERNLKEILIKQM